MPVVEAEIEQLEAYLDGELTADESRALEARLARDVKLAAEMDDLRAARVIRASVWRGLEGTDAEVDAVQSAIERELVRDHVWRRRALGLRWLAAAAASVLIGVGLGWSGRAVMSDHRGAVAPTGGSLASTGGAVVSPNVVADTTGGFRVALTDEAGNVLAVQRFDTMDDARQFTRDLRQWQQRQQQVRDGDVLLVGDRF